MSKDIKKVPQLRFPGFEDEWEERSLEIEAEVIMGQSPLSDNYTQNPDDYILVQGNSDIKDGKVFPRVWTTQVTKLAEKGDLIFSVRAPVGDVAKTDYNAVIGRGVAVVRGNEFLYQQLIKMKETRYWDRYIAGSTFESIKAIDVKSCKMVFPTKDEQEKIGCFFKKIDEIILRNRSKIEQLKNQKQALLQKMFPQNGSNIPEVRFSEFSEEWENTCLGELGEVMTGNTPKIAEKDNWSPANSKFIWITPTDIKDLISSDSERYLSLKGWEKARTVPKNSILITSIASIGKNTINTVPVAFNQQINAIIPSDNDAYFILTAMIKNEERFSSIAGKSATAIINKTEFKKFKIMIPTDLQEQRRIGEFFQQLDILITLHKRKLEHLELQKKALLQQLFV